jgi:hypothetical protein
MAASLRCRITGTASLRQNMKRRCAGRRCRALAREPNGRRRTGSCGRHTRRHCLTVLSYTVRQSVQPGEEDRPIGRSEEYRCVAERHRWIHSAGAWTRLASAEAFSATNLPAPQWLAPHGTSRPNELKRAMPVRREQIPRDWRSPLHHLAHTQHSGDTPNSGSRGANIRWHGRCYRNHKPYGSYKHPAVRR